MIAATASSNIGGGYGALPASYLYVFERGATWKESSRFQYAPLTAFSLSISGDGGAIALGMPGSSVSISENDMGSGGWVQIYESKPTQWVHLDAIVPLNGDDEGRFGSSVSLSSDGSYLVLSDPESGNSVRHEEGEVEYDGDAVTLQKGRVFTL